MGQPVILLIYNSCVHSVERLIPRLEAAIIYSCLQLLVIMSMDIDAPVSIAHRASVLQNSNSAT
jgi:hypothetical protein